MAASSASMMAVALTATVMVCLMGTTFALM
jgi:hypothetical protein